MKVFGCRVWDLVLGAGKLDKRAVECVYLGKASGVKGYRPCSIHDKKIRISRDANFEEDIFPYKMSVPTLVTQNEPKNIVIYDYDSNENVDDDSDQNVDVSQNLTFEYVGVNDGDVNLNQNVALENIVNDVNLQIVDVNVDEKPIVNQEGPCRSERERKPRNTSECCLKAVCSKNLIEPNTVNEVFLREDRDECLEAMKTEIDDLKKIKTWIVVKKPERANIVGSKWVFAIKTNVDGSLKRKARLAAQGHTQIYRIDFWESYSPVLR